MWNPFIARHIIDYLTYTYMYGISDYLMELVQFELSYLYEID